MAKKQWLNIKDYAETRDTTQRYIRYLIEKGKIPENCTRMYQNQKQVHKDRADSELAGNIVTDTEIDKMDSKHAEVVLSADLPVYPKLLDAQKAKETYIAALKKLEYEEKSGSLVDIVEVRKQADKAARVVKSRLMALKSRISPMVAAEDTVFECEQIIQREVDIILDEISRDIISEDN